MNIFCRKVKCAVCKCYLDKEDAQEVKLKSAFPGDSTFYCEIHRVPYDKILCFTFSPIRYYAELEVDESGDPIGYKKIKKERMAKSKIN